MHNERCLDLIRLPYSCFGSLTPHYVTRSSCSYRVEVLCICGTMIIERRAIAYHAHWFMAYGLDYIHVPNRIPSPFATFNPFHQDLTSITPFPIGLTQRTSNHDTAEPPSMAAQATTRRFVLLLSESIRKASPAVTFVYGESNDN
jgi:hypothetical protein